MGTGKNLFSHPFRSFGAEYVVIPGATTKQIIPLVRMCTSISDTLVEQPFIFRRVYVKHFTQMSGPCIMGFLSV